MSFASKLIDRDHRAASICMLLAFAAYSILYPLNMVFLERAGWIWNYPARNFAMEHMLVVNYVVLGAFFLYGARAPLRYLPLIDFTIVFNILHATMMLIDALGYPSHEAHIRLGGDVPATYLIPILLVLSHPKHFYLPFRDKNVEAQDRVKISLAAWLASGLLCLHLVGTGILVAVMWEQSTSEASTAQATSNYFRLLVKDICRTVPAVTRRAQ